jgi:hypothetical protein
MNRTDTKDLFDAMDEAERRYIARYPRRNPNTPTAFAEQTKITREIIRSRRIDEPVGMQTYRICSSAEIANP